ncbi:DUF6445 family protein [Shewanella salipaludis]|uniref:Uncharacterized protein n=1 Tax=Shewanella salipaludis TaxID=2723052 RepID=A0A972JKA6_9GAMM|nr:DUF6445 family protein [Shewanella salipaludis]NMH64914.1 hypothetical protein [Shewanella salipaludis]
MHDRVPEGIEALEVPYNAPILPYEKPELEVNYWIADDFFPEQHAIEISNRCFNKPKWKLGKPYTNELWPGRRSHNALNKKELSIIEEWVKVKIKKDKLWVEKSDTVVVDSNAAILVGEEEGSARPHVDNRKLCRYAAVLFLSPKPEASAGTSFYRLKYTNGAAGGNIVPSPFFNLVDALNVTSLPSSAWYLDQTIENKFNRLILFKGNMVHSASAYFGKEKREKRLAVTFFWMTED